MNTLSITISATQDVTSDQLEHMRLTAAAQYGVPQALIDKLISRTLLEAEFIQLLQAVTHDATRCNCCGHTRGAHVDEVTPAPAAKGPELESLTKPTLARMASFLGEKGDWARYSKGELLDILNFHCAEDQLLALRHVEGRAPETRPVAAGRLSVPANITMEDAAKEIGTSRIRLFAWMRDSALITLRNVPSASGLKRGLVATSKGGRGVLVTPKGLDHIRRAAMPQQATLM